MISFQQIELHSNKKIFLKMVPVDPLSLFRSYYANLNYDISRVYLKQIKVDKKEFVRGEYVYASLAKDKNEKFHKLTAVSHDRPSLSPGQCFIRARIWHVYKHTRGKMSVRTENGEVKKHEQRWRIHFKPDDKVILYLRDNGEISHIAAQRDDFKPPKRTKFERATVLNVENIDDTELNIKYGIESYFVEETRGQALEREFRGRDRNLYAEISLSKRGRALIRRIFLNDQPLSY